MTTDVIRKPRQSHRLCDVATTDNKVQGKVLYTDRDPLLAKQDDVPDTRDCHAYHAKGIAVAEAVSQVCGHNTDDCSHDKDWSTAGLGLLGLVAELLDDSRDEELRKIGKVSSAKASREFHDLEVVMHVTYRS